MVRGEEGLSWVMQKGQEGERQRRRREDCGELCAVHLET